MQKTILLAVAAALLIGIGAFAGYSAGAQERRTLKTNQVARVGQHVITAEQLLERLWDVEKMMMAPDRRIKPALDTLVAERMLEAEATRIDPISGGQLKAREVQTEVDLMLAQARTQLEIDNKKLLADQRKAGQPEKPWTWDQWLELRLQMTPQEFDNLLRIRARNDLLKRMVIWYWFRSSHNIDVQVIECDNPTVMEDVQRRLAAGEDFSALAAAKSIHQTARQNSPGLLAEIVKGEGALPKVVEEQAWKMADGETSAPIKHDKSQFIVRRIATNKRIPNEAKFIDQRDDCLKAPNVGDKLFERWRNSVANSGLYAYEERLPGRDVQADE